MSIVHMISLSPDSCPELPPLALPLLTGYLMENDVKCSQDDPIIHLKDDLFSKPVIEELIEVIIPYIEELRFGSINFPHLIHYSKMFNIKDGRNNLAKIVELKKDLQKRNYSFLYKRGSLRNIKQVYSIFSIISEILNGLNWIYPLTNEFNLELGARIQETIDKISNTKCDILGVSLQYSTTFAEFILPLIKKNRNDLKIVVGGSAIFRNHNFFKFFTEKNPAIDFIIYSNGEEALLSLVKYLNGHRNIEEVPNLFLKSDNKFISNSLKPLDFVFLRPSFEGLPLSKYLSPVIPLRLSIKCYWSKCKFCNHHRVAKNYVSGNCDELVQTILGLKRELRTNFFYISDDSLRIDHLKQICEKIINQDIDIRWFAYLRPEKDIDVELIKLMYKAGFRRGEWGIESASNNVLKAMQKGTHIERVQKLLIQCKEEGIKNYCFFFAGYPTETYKELYKTVEFIEKNISLDIIIPTGIDIFYLFEETPVYREFVNNKFHGFTVRKPDIRGFVSYDSPKLSKTLTLAELVNRRFQEVEYMALIPTNSFAWALHFVLSDFKEKLENRNDYKKLVTF